MKHGGGSSKTAAWYGLKWNKLWIDFTVGLRNLTLGVNWHIQLNKKYRRNVDVNFHLILFTIGFMYFVDSWADEAVGDLEAIAGAA